MASDTKTYPGSKVFSRIEINKWSLMGRHHLVLLSHPEFNRAQSLDLICFWYTSMTCPQAFPLQYDFLLMIVYCTESYETNRMQRHCRQIVIISRNGKENDKWFLTQTSANISGSPTSEMSSCNIHGQTLNETSKAMYLGVTLSWNSHNDTVKKKASQTTAFLRRNLSSCPKDVKAKCYKSIVRPQLEYASTVWDPVTKSNIAKVESV